LNILRKLAVVIVALASVSVAQADVIEFDLDYSLSLAPIRGDFGDRQSIGDVGTFFTDEAFFFGLGDTLVFNILFDSRLHIFDFGEPTEEVFTFGSGCGYLCPQPNGGFNGTWTSSIEAIGGRGDIWSGPITVNWQGNGSIGWGGVALPMTTSHGSFTGVRWTTTLTSVNTGGPLLLAGFTGFSGSADGIRVTPVPEPGTLGLFLAGLAGMGLARRRKKT
jgi:hypothetical protein